MQKDSAMPRISGSWFAVIGLLAWMGTSMTPMVGAKTLTADLDAVQRLQSALATQAATRARLRVLGDAATCAQARHVAYRRSDREPDIVDEWYVASQLWADAALLPPARLHSLPSALPALPVPLLPIITLPGRLSPASGYVPETRCHLDKSFVFLQRLWDPTSGGYYPRSNESGTEVERGARYADDNA